MPVNNKLLLQRLAMTLAHSASHLIIPLQACGLSSFSVL